MGVGGSNCAPFNLGVSGVRPHLPEVEDEAVALVEAAPGQRHLLGTDVALPFDLIQPVHRAGGLRPPECRLNTALLWDNQELHKKNSSRLLKNVVFFSEQVKASDEILAPHLVANPSGEECHELWGFVALNVPVLDGFTAQEVVQLDGQHGTGHLLVPG